VGTLVNSVCNMLNYLHVCVYACVYAYVYGVVMCTSVCSGKFMGWVMCCSVSDPFGEIRTRYRRPGPDPDSCSLWTRYNGNLKIDSWDDP